MCHIFRSPEQCRTIVFGGGVLLGWGRQGPKRAAQLTTAILEYHLKKKKEEMEDLMARFTQTNVEHQHLMNDNIRLVAQIRKRKKEEVRKIKDQQKTRFKRKVKNLKKTIMMQSKVGDTGETIIRNSVLDKQFDKYSIADDSPAPPREQPGFFNKLRESMMIFTPGDAKRPRRPGQSSRSPRHRAHKQSSPASGRKVISPGKAKYDFKKKHKGSQRSRTSHEPKHDDESQIIDRKRFDGLSPFAKVKSRSRINNLSDASDDSTASVRKPNSIGKKAKKSQPGQKAKSGKSGNGGSKRFSPSRRLKTGKPLQPSKRASGLIGREEESRASQFGFRHF